MERYLTAATIAALVTAGTVACDDGSSGGNGGDASADTSVLDTGDVGDTSGTDADTAIDDADAADGADADSGTGDVTDATDADDDAADGGDAGPMCTGDGQCPGNAVCVQGECRRYTVVQIRDVTRRRSSSSGEACSEDSSGADLFELELQGPFGTPLGNARTVRADSKARTNTLAATVFDGSSNSLDQTPSGLCPSAGFSSDSVLSLGCGGSLIAVFTDGSGETLGLAGGQQLVVHEYGDQCCDSDCPEEFWEVRVCSARSPRQFQEASPDEDGIWPTCDTQTLGFGSARDTVTLQLPRP